MQVRALPGADRVSELIYRLFCTRKSKDKNPALPVFAFYSQSLAALSPTLRTGSRRCARPRQSTAHPRQLSPAKTFRTDTRNSRAASCHWRELDGASSMVLANRCPHRDKISSRAPIRLNFLQNVLAKCTIRLQSPASSTRKAYDFSRRFRVPPF